MEDHLNNILNMGAYYATINNGEFCADVYKHSTARGLYVVVLNGYNHSLTTVVNKHRYRKELDELFFTPMAQEIWNEVGIFESIKKHRIAE